MPGASDDESIRLLIRRLHGELAPAEAREVAERIAREPPLRALDERLRASWEALELPPPAVPADFRAAVMAAARREQRGELSWAVAPAWARAGAAVALALGVLLGVGFGSRSQLLPEPQEEVALVSEPISLAEAYWLTLDQGGDQLLDAEEDGP